MPFIVNFSHNLVMEKVYHFMKKEVNHRNMVHLDIKWYCEEDSLLIQFHFISSMYANVALVKRKVYYISIFFIPQVGNTYEQ